MDPLSATASIIAILQLSSKVVAYLTEVRDASKERKKCAVETSTLHSLLLNLRFRLEEGSADRLWYTAVRALAVENGPLDQFKQALETLQTTITDGGRLKKASDALVWKFKKKEVASILNRIERLKTLVEIALQMDHFKLSQAIKDDTNFVRTHVPIIQSGVDEIRQDQDAARHRRLLEWISPTEYPAQQSDIINGRQEGTCQWFLDAPEVARWLREAKSTLFCPGIPGAGKTMVAAIAIDHLSTSVQDSSHGVAYVYCNYKSQEELDASGMLAAILKQLVQARPSVVEPVDRLHKKHADRGTRPSLDEVFSALQDVLARYSTVHIVIDALDECRESDGTRRQLLARIRELQTRMDVHLMVTSRFIPGIVDTFREALQLEVRASGHDVKRFVAGKMDRLPKFVQRNPALQEMVQEKIVEAVDGMFLLARLHTESLIDKATAKDVKLTLAKLSKGSTALDNAYRDALQRIEGQLAGHYELAKKVLSWITFAKRPLTTTEICSALAVEPGEAILDSDNIPDVEDLVSVCAGLIVVDQESAIVRLVHYTTQEYFERIKDAWNPTAQLQLTTTCITYLSFDAFRSGSCTTDKEFEERLRQNEFLDYAAKHWAEHARDAEPDVSGLACSFLLENDLVSNASQVLLVGSYQYTGYSQSFPVGSSVHYTAQFGLARIMEDLLSTMEGDSTIAVNALDSLGRPPLFLAAKHGHEEMAKLLLDNGADIHAQSRDNGDALYAASAEGHNKVVKLLLGAGADVNAQGGRHGNALEASASVGKEQVAKLLLDAGANTATPGGLYGNALFAAVAEGHEDLTKLLLEEGVDVTTLDAQWKGAMHYAVNSANCKPSLVKLLLDRGAPMDTVDTNNMTPLHYSVKFGYISVAKLLLDSGVPIDARVHRTPWFRNADRGTYERFASVSAPNVSRGLSGLTPLHFAALIGHSTMTGFLLGHGADSNALSDHDESPLHLALRTTLHGTEYKDDWVDPHWRAECLWDFVDFEEDDVDAISADISQHRIAVLDRLLADPRTNTMTKDCEGEYPIHCIQYKNPDSTTVLHKLVSKGADPCLGNAKQQSVLHLASGAGDHKSVDFLLSLGADVTSTDDEGRNALHYSAREGDYQTMATILENKQARAVNLAASKDRHGMNALHHLLSRASSNKVNAVQLLLSQGVDSSELDDTGRSPLAHHFSSSLLTINVEVCQLLLEIEGNADFVDKHGQTLAHLCARSLDFSVEIINVLREKGVDMTKSDLKGRTVLHCAAIRGSITKESLDFLCDIIGLRLSAKDSRGKTALQYAREEAAKDRNRQIWDPERWNRSKNLLEQQLSTFTSDDDNNTLAQNIPPAGSQCSFAAIP